MNTRDAQLLISRGVDRETQSHWADLGCGEGTFTAALAELLAPGSTIHAIDKDKSVLTKVKGTSSVTIITKTLDFTRGVAGLTNLDGVLMANAFHFVADKRSFMSILKTMISPERGRILFVEYDTSIANRWVPYPIPFQTLSALVIESGFATIEKTGVYPSVFGNLEMYAALVKPWRVEVQLHR